MLSSHLRETDIITPVDRAHIPLMSSIIDNVSFGGKLEHICSYRPLKTDDFLVLNSLVKEKLIVCAIFTPTYCHH